MRENRNILELLAPAKNLDCGKAAIDHGADAVYIGAPQFGARKAASNSIADIEELTAYAHLFGARIYVALNTLLFDQEFDDALRIAWQVYDAGADALIIQDAGLLESELPPIALHASTQMDNRTLGKVQFWENIGFEQVVLARELSEQQIREIAANTKVRLEAFIHGALCVSYSGQCYMSHCINGRSANRGECGQPCRLAYDLRDAQGHTLERNRHLLSLKDFNQTKNLEALIDAGVSSFKIEGRLKDVDYVSNITLHYRQRLDEIIARRPELRRASTGNIIAGFEPNPAKSFNRGFTTYFFNGRNPDIWQPATPKSIGEYLGHVICCHPESFKIEGNPAVSNGDGLCFPTSNGTFDGVNVNKVEKGIIFPRSMNGIHNGMPIFRNANVAFDATIKNDTTRRTIPIDIRISADDDCNFSIEISDTDGIRTVYKQYLDADTAQNRETSRENMQRQLSKLGQTAFEHRKITVDESAARYFVPASALNALRRNATDAHTLSRQKAHVRETFHLEPNNEPYIEKNIGRNGNIINERARKFYERHGARMTDWVYVSQQNNRGQVVMTTKHCLMNSLGMCLRKNPQCRQILPLTLSNDKDKYELTFDCKKCEMTVRKT